MIRGAVLAGGAARRYGGRPKGLLQVGGRRILDHVVDVVGRATGGPPLLVANAPDSSTWRPDLHTVPDARPGHGSLGGIYTAVTAGAGPVLCVAWDMPFVTAELLAALVEGAEGTGGTGGGYDAFLPESGGKRSVEPLCAVYGPACAPAIQRRLAAGDLKAIGFHGDVRVGTLSLDRVRAFGDPEVLFFNVNTPDDLARAKDLWRERG